MKIAVLKEREAGETRVAITPDAIKKYKALGADVTIEAGAGQNASIRDEDYVQAGAAVAATIGEVVKDADIVLKLRPPRNEELSAMKRGALVAAMLNPHARKDRLAAYANAGVMAFAMELMPRITRAQSMDVLSSQSNLAGYKAAVNAAAMFNRGMPMMMTAAGTVAPARVFVMGAGVAGLQAIATAKRLGAIVSATDVRPAAKEQVKSLGGEFVMVENEESRRAETSAGYAREMSEDYRRQQAELIAQTVKKQDIVITTALIPGRPAPVLVTEAMVRTMKPGSLIIDMAVEQGGNCPLSKMNEIVEVNGVRVVGAANLASELAADASSLYARNLVNFLTPLIDKANGVLKIDWEDDIVKGTLLTRDGQIVHPAFKAN
jgi:NAD(P) transhydrogenase subunit alpha